MPKKPKDIKIQKFEVANLKTITRAAKDGNLGLAKCRVRATGEVVTALTAFGGDGESIVLTPLALMIQGNPYELLEPPNPDGGFYEDKP
jgi:hypothetical protein